MDDDGALVARVRSGDEAAFAELVRRHQPRLLRLAEMTVGSRAVAEEACQDTWLAVVRGVEHFEGRSTFRTWLFHILLNRARSSAGREQRAGRADGPAIERFDAAGAWVDPPTPWGGGSAGADGVDGTDGVDDRLDAADLAHRVHGLLPQLPEHQRQVVVLRDVEGLSASEVSALLDLTDGNQRVLLHRGRAKLRSLLAVEMGGSVEGR